MDLTETQISSTPIDHSNFLHIDCDHIRLPNGNEQTRVVVRHPGASCVLAVTPENKVVLVRQWRYAVGHDTLEIPAGKLDEGEDPAVCALRELGEETPYTAERVEKIAHFYSAPGFCNEVLHLYRAVNITPTSTLSPDQDEFVETEFLSKDEARAAIATGKILDAKTLIALQFWLAE
ncbi:NUDIX hydrolase [Kingella negevensis]|uniref:NUDIX hydrolase n=1 Tax=Kingella negevensis TaxID=1522312 RepID=UPI00050A31DC|nr:NUDIX hydrolase [Kingella negevensis]MDK4689287.1 NUDIX hydrolase [Kingella negevensis]WII91361.1 NUDIX hydrolase [Kingella negevensis]